MMLISKKICVELLKNAILNFYDFKNILFLLIHTNGSVTFLLNTKSQKHISKLPPKETIKIINPFMSENKTILYMNTMLVL